MTGPFCYHYNLIDFLVQFDVCLFIYSMFMFRTQVDVWIYNFFVLVKVNLLDVLFFLFRLMFARRKSLGRWWSFSGGTCPHPFALPDSDLRFVLVPEKNCWVPTSVRSTQLQFCSILFNFTNSGLSRSKKLKLNNKNLFYKISKL